MVLIPDEYVIQKFYQYCGAPKYNKHNKTYQGSCPICREGKSWLRKKRCYFIPSNNNIFCHNCGWSGTPLRWLREVTGLNINEIKEEIGNIDLQDQVNTESIPKLVVDTLPSDSINLFDGNQVEFYKNELIVKRAIEYIKYRKLDTACNKPTAMFLSLTDRLHKNRLIIPFYDERNKIVHYQTRTILKADEKSWPRYISKQGSEKTLFNFNNIDSTLDSYFIFEGPFNACFCINSVAVAGIQDNSYQLFTDKQQQQVNQLSFLQRVWVLDSQWLDNAALNKSLILAQQNEKVFIWPEKIGRLKKDFNDIAMSANIDQVSADFILKNTYTGIRAQIMLKNMK